MKADTNATKIFRSFNITLNMYALSVTPMSKILLNFLFEVFTEYNTSSNFTVGSLRICLVDILFGEYYIFRYTEINDDQIRVK
jgi:hypothetical protein